MKNEVAGFLQWFEKEREKLIDRIFEALGRERYEGVGCGLVMELHQQSLTAAAAQVANARACQQGTAASTTPFLGYEAYRYSLVHEGIAGDLEPPAAKKRRGPGRKRKEAEKADNNSSLFPVNEMEGASGRDGE